MILFAYAGNMDIEYFSKSVPSAKKIAIAKLLGYCLAFNTAAADGSSKANVVKTLESDAEVWGVLIDIKDEERFNFFNPDPQTNDLLLEQVNCITQDGAIYQAEVFTAKPHAINPHILPYDWYHARLAKLAEDVGLPKSYINQLVAMPFKIDPNETRRTKRKKKYGL